MFHGVKEERYSNTRMLLVLLVKYGCIWCTWNRAFVYLVCGNLLLTSLRPIWHPCLLFLVMTHHCIVTLVIGVLINTFNHLAAIIVEILFTDFARSWPWQSSGLTWGEKKIILKTHHLINNHDSSIIIQLIMLKKCLPHLDLSSIIRTHLRRDSEAGLANWARMWLRWNRSH